MKKSKNSSAVRSVDTKTLDRIFMYLDLKDLAMVRAVCRKWRDVVYGEGFCKRYVKRHFPALTTEESERESYRDKMEYLERCPIYESRTLDRGSAAACYATLSRSGRFAALIHENSTLEIWDVGGKGELLVRRNMDERYGWDEVSHTQKVLDFNSAETKLVACYGWGRPPNSPSVVVFAGKNFGVEHAHCAPYGSSSSVITWLDGGEEDETFLQAEAVEDGTLLVISLCKTWHSSSPSKFGMTMSVVGYQRGPVRRYLYGLYDLGRRRMALRWDEGEQEGNHFTSTIGVYERRPYWCELVCHATFNLDDLGGNDIFARCGRLYAHFYVEADTMPAAVELRVTDDEKLALSRGQFHLRSYRHFGLENVTSPDVKMSVSSLGVLRFAVNADAIVGYNPAVGGDVLVVKTNRSGLCVHKSAHACAVEMRKAREEEERMKKKRTKKQRVVGERIKRRATGGDDKDRS